MNFLIMESQKEFRKLPEVNQIYCKCTKFPKKSYFKEKNI